MSENRLIGPLEIGLLVGIVVLALGGTIYAGLAGIISIPGVPALLADKKIDPPTETISPPAADPDVQPSADASTDGVATASPAASPATTPSSAANPEAEKTKRDEQRSKDLALIMRYVQDYAKANKGAYPESEAFRTSWTDDTNSPLVKALVPKYATALPTDPLLGTEKRRYGYKKVEDDCEITANFENTKNAGVKLSTDPDGKQVYLMTIYCRDY